jgi:hypothetical protein
MMRISILFIFTLRCNALLEYNAFQNMEPVDDLFDDGSIYLRPAKFRRTSRFNIYNRVCTQVFQLRFSS